MACLFFQAGDGIRGGHVTGVQTCALPIYYFRWKHPGERLDVAIENNAHDLALTVKRRAARVSSDDVRRRDVRSEERRVGKAWRTPFAALHDYSDVDE